MNYMWEALLEGDEQGLKKEDIHFKPSKIANPYREVFSQDFNKNTLTSEPLEVNAYYRYAAVFRALLEEDMDAYSEIQELLFDVLAHDLSELDLREGLCHAEYYAKFLQEDIEKGRFGGRNADALRCFPKSKRRFVLSGLLRLYSVGTSTRLFAQLLRELYPNSIVYLDTCYGRELLIYIGKKKTEALAAQMDLLCDTFVPLDYKVQLFWEKHFGLIGVDETMQIGDIMMF